MEFCAASPLTSSLFIEAWTRIGAGATAALPNCGGPLHWGKTEQVFSVCVSGGSFRSDCGSDALVSSVIHAIERNAPEERKPCPHLLAQFSMRHKPLTLFLTLRPIETMGRQA